MVMFSALKHHLKWNTPAMERHLVINGLTVNVKEHWNSYRIQLLLRNSNISKAEAEQLLTKLSGESLNKTKTQYSYPSSSQINSKTEMP